MGVRPRRTVAAGLDHRPDRRGLAPGSTTPPAPWSPPSTRPAAGCGVALDQAAGRCHRRRRRCLGGDRVRPARPRDLARPGRRIGRHAHLRPVRAARRGARRRGRAHPDRTRSGRSGPVEVTNPTGAVTRYCYDRCGRLGHGHRRPGRGDPDRATTSTGTLSARPCRPARSRPASSTPAAGSSPITGPAPAPCATCYDLCGRVIETTGSAQRPPPVLLRPGRPAGRGHRRQRRDHPLPLRREWSRRRDHQPGGWGHPPRVRRHEPVHRRDRPVGPDHPSRLRRRGPPGLAGEPGRPSDHLDLRRRPAGRRRWPSTDVPSPR